MPVEDETALATAVPGGHPRGPADRDLRRSGPARRDRARRPPGDERQADRRDLRRRRRALHARFPSSLPGVSRSKAISSPGSGAGRRSPRRRARPPAGRPARAGAGRRSGDVDHRDPGAVIAPPPARSARPVPVGIDALDVEDRPGRDAVRAPEGTRPRASGGGVARGRALGVEAAPARPLRRTGERSAEAASAGIS